MQCARQSIAFLWVTLDCDIHMSSTAVHVQNRNLGQSMAAPWSLLWIHPIPPSHPHRANTYLYMYLSVLLTFYLICSLNSPHTTVSPTPCKHLYLYMYLSVLISLISISNPYIRKAKRLADYAFQPLKSGGWNVLIATTKIVRKRASNMTEHN